MHINIIFLYTFSGTEKYIDQLYNNEKDSFGFEYTNILKHENIFQQ